ncbi:hypothetical protein D3C79_869200 [compost metagenome]
MTKAKISFTFDSLMMTLPMLQASALIKTSSKPVVVVLPGLTARMPTNPVAASAIPTNCGPVRGSRNSKQPHARVKNALN